MGIWMPCTSLDKVLERRVRAHLGVYSICSDGVVRNVFHVRFAPIEGCIEDGSRYGTDSGVFVILNAEEGLEKG